MLRAQEQSVKSRRGALATLAALGAGVGAALVEGPAPFIHTTERVPRLDVNDAVAATVMPGAADDVGPLTPAEATIIRAWRKDGRRAAICAIVDTYPDEVTGPREAQA